MKRKIVAGLLCICFALLLFDSVFAQDQQQRRRRTGSRFSWKPELEIGDKVQDFELQILDGGTFKLSEKRGTIIVLELGACTWPPYLNHLPEMDKIAVDFKDKGVEFYNLYTREPHAGEDHSRRSGDKRYDWSNVPQTRTMDEREDYALKMIKDFNQVRAILIDIFPDNEKGIKSVQQWLGGRAPNSGIVIDRDGKMVFWQQWASPKDLRENIEKLLAAEKK